MSNSIEYEGTEVSRPMQDTFKMKKLIAKQKQEIEQYRLKVADALKTINDLEKKLTELEDKFQRYFERASAEGAKAHQEKMAGKK